MSIFSYTATDGQTISSYRSHRSSKATQRNTSSDPELLRYCQAHYMAGGRLRRFFRSLPTLRQPHDDPIFVAHAAHTRSESEPTPKPKRSWRSFRHHDIDDEDMVNRKAAQEYEREQHLLLSCLNSARHGEGIIPLKLNQDLSDYLTANTDHYIPQISRTTSQRRRKRLEPQRMEPTTIKPTSSRSRRTALVALISPPSLGALTCGQLWTSGKHNMHSPRLSAACLRQLEQRTPYGCPDTCSCHLFWVWNVVTDRRWKTIGIAKDFKTGRWVIELAERSLHRRTVVVDKEPTLQAMAGRAPSFKKKGARAKASSPSMPDRRDKTKSRGRERKPTLPDTRDLEKALPEKPKEVEPQEIEPKELKRSRSFASIFRLPPKPDMPTEPMPTATHRIKRKEVKSQARWPSRSRQSSKFNLSAAPADDVPPVPQQSKPPRSPQVWHAVRRQLSRTAMLGGPTIIVDERPKVPTAVKLSVAQRDWEAQKAKKLKTQAYQKSGSVGFTGGSESHRISRKPAPATATKSAPSTQGVAKDNVQALNQLHPALRSAGQDKGLMTMPARPDTVSRYTLATYLLNYRRQAEQESKEQAKSQMPQPPAPQPQQGVAKQQAYARSHERSAPASKQQIKAQTVQPSVSHSGLRRPSAHAKQSSDVRIDAELQSWLREKAGQIAEKLEAIDKTRSIFFDYSTPVEKTEVGELFPQRDNSDVEQWLSKYYSHDDRPSQLRQESQIPRRKVPPPASSVYSVHRTSSPPPMPPVPPSVPQLPRRKAPPPASSVYNVRRASTPPPMPSRMPPAAPQPVPPIREKPARPLKLPEWAPRVISVSTNPRSTPPLASQNASEWEESDDEDAMPNTMGGSPIERETPVQRFRRQPVPSLLSAFSPGYRGEVDKGFDELFGLLPPVELGNHPEPEDYVEPEEAIASPGLRTVKSWQTTESEITDAYDNDDYTDYEDNDHPAQTIEMKALPMISGRL